VSAPINDGKYSADKVPTGPAKIAVTSFIVDPAVDPKLGRRVAPPKDAPIPPEVRKSFEGGGEGKKGIKIPVEYGDPAKSGLTYTVESGQQTHDIKLP
jgi:hypothetical protein